MGLENLKSVFNVGITGKPTQNFDKQNTSFGSELMGNTSFTTTDTFSPSILGTGGLSGFDQTNSSDLGLWHGPTRITGNTYTELISIPRISFGVGEVYPISNIKLKVGLSGIGNKANIYFLGSGKENYENWGGWTKHGDTLAITGQLSNFGKVEDFLNNSLGITVPDIPLLGPQFTFYKPIKYTDTVFELRGSDATSLATTGFLDSSADGLRGAAMQVMEGNRKGKTEYLLDGGSFVKFVNQQQGSAAHDVADFIVDTAGDIGGHVGSLLADTGNAIKSGLGDFKREATKDLKKLVTGFKVDKFSGSLFDIKIKFPKITTPSVNLPSLSELLDFLPDLPKIETPSLGGFGPIPIKLNFIKIKPSKEVLNYLKDIRNDITKNAIRIKNNTASYLQKQKQEFANNIAKPIKNRLKEFGEDVVKDVTSNYKNLEKDLGDALKQRIPGAGDGGGTALANTNPRAIPDVSRGFPTPKRTHTYSELGTTITSGKNGIGRYESDVNNEKALGDFFDLPGGGDGTLTDQSGKIENKENPSLLSNKHVKGNNGNIHSSQAGLSGIGKLSTAFEEIPFQFKYESLIGNEENLGASEGDPLNEKTTFDSSLLSFENPQSIVSKHIEGFTSTFGSSENKHSKPPFDSPFSGLDHPNEKYTSNVESVQTDSDFDFDRTVGGDFYPANVNGGTGDLHTIIPALNGDTLTDASTNWPNFQEVVESEKYGMPFYFKDLRDNKYVVFRAYLQSLTEDLSPNWTPENYIGRSESVYSYTSTERTINFTFRTASHSQNELGMIYEKINLLTSMVYPEYKKDGNLDNKIRMKPPLTRFRLGELFGNSKHDIAGFIKSLSYTWPENSPWEIENGKRVPKVCDITVAYQVIHEAPPSYDTPAQHFHGYMPS